MTDKEYLAIGIFVSIADILFLTFGHLHGYHVFAGLISLLAAGILIGRKWR